MGFRYGTQDVDPLLLIVEPAAGRTEGMNGVVGGGVGVGVGVGGVGLVGIGGVLILLLLWLLLLLWGFVVVG